MPYPSLTFANLLESATRTELEQFVSLLQGYLSEQHKDDGSHSAVTADSVDVSGDATVGGDLDVDGTVTADADGSPVQIGATGSGPGIDIDNETAGTSHWRLFADYDSANPRLAFKDVSQVSDNAFADIVRTASGVTPAYVLRPHASTIDLSLGTDSAGQRLAGVAANVYRGGETGTWTPGLAFGGATTGITYSTQAGTYTRLCDLVVIELRIVLTSKGSATGTASITGLPFTALGNPSAVIDFGSGSSGLASTPYAAVATTTLFPLHISGGTRTQLTDANFTGTDDFRLGLLYRV